MALKDSLITCFWHNKLKKLDSVSESNTAEFHFLDGWDIPMVARCLTPSEY